MQQARTCPDQQQRKAEAPRAKEVVDLREHKGNMDTEMSVCVQKFDRKLEACSCLLSRFDVKPASISGTRIHHLIEIRQKELQAHHRLEASQFQPAAETVCTLALCCRSTRAGHGERHCINMQILEIQRQLRPWPQRQVSALSWAGQRLCIPILLFLRGAKFPSCSDQFCGCGSSQPPYRIFCPSWLLNLCPSVSPLALVDTR